MAKIIIQTELVLRTYPFLFNKISQTCQTNPNLSPRSLKEISQAYNEKRLLLALDKTKVVGWLLRIPYNSAGQELAAGYVLKAYRSKGVFNKLLKAALEYSSISLVVTFNYPLANYLTQKMGFKNSSLWEAIKISKGTFLLHRLSITRVKAIKKHYQTCTPVYIIFRK